MAVDGKLVFSRPHDSTGRLIFGDDAEVVIPPAEIGVDAQFADDMACTVQLLWDANVSRGEAIEVRAHWQAGEPVSAGAASHWQDARLVTARAASHWQQGAAMSGRTAEHWQDSQRLNARTGVRWQDGQGLRAAALAKWQEAERLRSTSGLRWQDGAELRHALLARYQEAIHLRSVALSIWQDATPSRTLVRHRGRAGLPVHLGLALRWQDARRPPAGISIVTVPVDPPGDPCYDPETLGRLEFTEPWANNGHLIFVCRDTTQPGAAVTVPVRRVYIVINNANLRRVADNVVVPCFDLSISLDRDSWTWGFRARAPRVAEDLLLDGDPVELVATINGTDIRLVVEDVQRDRPGGTLSVSGRGRNALLDEKYQPQTVFGNAAQRTAQQLMMDVLSVNGTPLGWALDWQLTDWIVPAGAFTHMGTYQTAVAAIAAAAGGYIRPHPSAMSMSILPQYPVAPWDWPTATPAFELPAAVATREGLRRVSKPMYDRVFVMGESTGVSREVVRAGTAGDLVAPMVVDPLITAHEAARQRGLAVLGDTGKQKQLSLSLPVLPETGIILPGALLRYVDEGAAHLGLVRGVNIDVRFPNVTQTLEVESHE